MKPPAIAGALVALLALVAPAAHATVYKCTQGGNTVYSDTPCPSAKVVAGTGADAGVSRSDQHRARARALRDEAALLELEQQKAADKRKRRECELMAARHNRAVADANKRPNDQWWQLRANDSRAELKRQCAGVLPM